jgi:CO/xanthine dehydrogenase FAD-binding subunit
MVRFQVLQPKTLSEACSLLARHIQEAKVVAGGQNLLVLLKQRRIKPRFVINIKQLSEMEYITHDSGSLRIGALTTHRAIEKSMIIRGKYPILSDLEERLGCVQTRNWGTIGGNLCQASPATDPPPALIALGAKVKAMSVRGVRTISLDDFFIGYQRTILEPDEILVEIQLPEPPLYSGAAYHKETVRLADPPIASVAAMVTIGGQKTIESVRIVMQAVGVTPLRAAKAERAIEGEKMTEGLIEKAARLAAEEAQPISDVYGSADYKREMVKVATKRAVKEAFKRATKLVA